MPFGIFPKIIHYDSRRTGDRFLDTGSTPVCSTWLNPADPHKLRVCGVFIFLGFVYQINLYPELNRDLFHCSIITL